MQTNYMADISLRENKRFELQNNVPYGELCILKIREILYMTVKFFTATRLK